MDKDNFVDHETFERLRRQRQPKDRTFRSPRIPNLSDYRPWPSTSYVDGREVWDTPLYGDPNDNMVIPHHPSVLRDPESGETDSPTPDAS